LCFALKRLKKNYTVVCKNDKARTSPGWAKSQGLTQVEMVSTVKSEGTSRHIAA
jgi:hypothetical protein